VGAPVSKKTVLVYISDEVYNELIKRAPELYGKSKGALSYVVETALRKFLGLEPEAPGTHTETHTHNRVSIIYNKVIEVLKARYGYTPDQIIEKDLDDAIGVVRGLDPRTVSKWKTLFIRQKCVEIVSSGVGSRVFKVNVKCGQ
jgi:hypothetical protein